MMHILISIANIQMGRTFACLRNRFSLYPGRCTKLCSPAHSINVSLSDILLVHKT